MKRAVSALLFCASAAAASGAPAGDALVFLAGQGRPAPSLTSAEVRRIWVGETTRWSDGKRILLAVRPASTEAGRFFYRRVVDMTEIDFSRLWLGILFRGDASSAPRVIDSAEEVRRFLAGAPDGLAFLLSGEIDRRDPGLRPLRIDGHAPGTAGYPYDASR